MCNPLVEPFEYDTIKSCLVRYANTWPEKEAIVFYTPDCTRSSITFGKLYEQSLQCARGLLALGIQSGDVVGIGLPNIYEWVVCHFGTAFAGAVTLGFPYFGNDGQNIVNALQQCGKCTAIIFGPTQEKANIVRNFVGGSDSSGKVNDSLVQSLKFAVRVGPGKTDDFPFTFDSLMDLGFKSSKIELPYISPDDVCVIIMSSGTTGHCKLIPKTHFHITSVKQMTNHVMQFEASDIYFSASPFIWIGGYVVSLLNFGHTLITVTELMKFRTTKDFALMAATVIERENCTAAGLYGPALLEYLSGDVKCSKFPLKFVITGGYPLSNAYAAVIGNVARRLVGAYGCTEIGSICYTDISRQEDFREYIAGQPLRGIELKIVDESGRICQRNVLGEIYVRPSVHFLGYINDPPTGLVVDRTGWYKTNDAGYVSHDGQVIVTGRMSDVIIIGGAKISPVNVENIISAHPKIADVAVVAIDDKKMFQEACACIIKKPDCNVTWHEIKSFIEERNIAKRDSLYFKILIPKYHIFMENFPRTAVGKVAKKRLKDNAMNILENQEST